MTDEGLEFGLNLQLEAAMILQDLGGGWIATYTFGFDRPRIRSVSISRRMSAGSEPAEVIEGGELTSRVLRRLAPGAAIAFAMTRWREIAGPQSPTMPRYEQLADHLGHDWINAIEKTEPGATGRSALRLRGLAATAALYVGFMQKGERAPVAAMADEVGLSQSKVRDRLYAARRAGLLEETGRGRAGGQLTQQARDLLEREAGWRGESQVRRSGPAARKGDSPS